MNDADTPLKNLKTKPIDTFNHCLDALRYGLESEIRPWAEAQPKARGYAPTGIIPKDVQGGWDV